MLFKNFLKKHFLILKVRNRFSAQVQISQRSLYHYYKEKAASENPLPLSETGFCVFSQFEEDGMLLYIFAAIGMGSKTFVEIGSDDGINSNCANLAFNFGWTGLFIDRNATSIRRGKRFYAKYPHPWMYQPQFLCSDVTPSNIDQLISSAGITGEIELLSIDIDGDDYWIWKAIEIIQPKVVVIETHVRFGMHNIVVPYGQHHAHDYAVNHGASPVAMVNLGKQKGYKLIGANQLGFNFIFLKKELASTSLPEINVEQVLIHPSTVKSIAEFKPADMNRYVVPDIY